MATFMLVHGAWHGGWCWQRVAPRLRAAGHDVLTPTLTGLGDRSHLLSPQVGLGTHVEDLLGTLTYAGRDDDVVLVGHSYAGQVITGAASARPDGIRKLVYLDAFVADDGDRAIDLLPAHVAVHYRESVAEHGFGWLIPPRPLDVLGVEDPDDVAWLESHFVPHPWRTYTDPVTVTPMGSAVPAAFVECTDWLRVFEPFAKVAASRGWPVHELSSGHEAMVTNPAGLADVLLEIAAQAAVEFLVYTQNLLPAETDPEVVASLRAAERARAEELRADGILKRLWRVPGRWATVALYEAPDATALHEALTSLPMWPHTDVRVEPLATHPQEQEG